MPSSELSGHELQLVLELERVHIETNTDTEDIHMFHEDYNTLHTNSGAVGMRVEAAPLRGIAHDGHFSIPALGKRREIIFLSSIYSVNADTVLPTDMHYRRVDAVTEHQCLQQRPDGVWDHEKVGADRCNLR